MARYQTARRAGRGFLVALALCGFAAASNAADDGPTPEPAAVAPADATAPAVPADVMAQGEALYLKNCRLCHGSKGASGKPLKENENLADGFYVASVILLGPGYMAAFADHLSDEEIALITTYVRNSWGNAYGPMTSEDVATLR